MYLANVMSVLNHIEEKHPEQWKAHKRKDDRKKLIDSCFAVETEEQKVKEVEVGTHIVVPRR